MVMSAQYIEFPNGLKMLLAHADGRRVIYEANLGTLGAVQYCVISPDVPPEKRVLVGNHYHQKLEFEIFNIVKGGGELWTQQLDEHGQPVAGMFHRRLEPGARVVIPQLMAHTFALLPGTEMSILRSRPWDPQNPDLNPYPLQG